MPQNKSLIELVAMAYLLPGVVVGSISMCSTVIFYSFGPGAVWNVGFIAWIYGGVVGLFSSLLRVATWPYGFYILINNPDGFLPWLFFHWYQ